MVDMQFQDHKIKPYIRQTRVDVVEIEEKNGWRLPLYMHDWIHLNLTVGSKRNVQNSRRNISPYLIFLGIMRFRTLWFEECEALGIHVGPENDAATDFSRNHKYFDHYLGLYKGQRADKIPGLMMEKVKKEFVEESEFPNDAGEGIFGGSEYLQQELNPESHFFKKLFQFDLREALGRDDLPWRDFRVSKQYYRYAHLKHVRITFGDHENYYNTAQLISIEGCLSRGQMKPIDYVQHHLCFQHTALLKQVSLQQGIPVGNKTDGFSSSGLQVVYCRRYVSQSHPMYGKEWPQNAEYLKPIRLVRLQPRRVVIFSESSDKQHSIAVGFATYQYLELSQLLAHKPQGPHHKPVKQVYKKLTDMAIKNDQTRYKMNPNALECFLPKNVYPETPILEMYKISFQMPTVNFSVNEETGEIGPKVFSDKFITQSFQTKFKRLGKNFRSTIVGELVFIDEFGKQDGDKKLTGVSMLTDKLEQESEVAIIEQVAEEDGTQQLLRFIKSIPKIKFKLTNEQDLMISTPENLLCLGRSGTGKTTSSALRLFASDAFFKFKEQLSLWKLNNPQKRQKEFQIAPTFMDNDSSLKLLFVSASPVLVNEVKRFYVDLKQHLAAQLTQRQSAKQAAAEEAKGDPIVLQKPAEAAEEESEQALLLKFVENELQALEMDEQIEKQSEIVSKMSQLKQKDYPLFLTVKRLIMMLDASTYFPFFSRDADGKQVGLNGNLEWSNEQGGVFMINQYHRRTQTDFDDVVQKLGQKILDVSSDLEVSNQITDEELKKQSHDETAEEQENVRRFQEATADMDEKEKMSLQSQNLSFEVDFDVFSTRFWPKVGQQVKVAPLVAWTEICSEIKGRVDSFTFNDGGISSELYIQKNRKKKTGFLTELEKSQIYWIFVKYEQWKVQYQAYDQNDVVNHILQQIQQGFADQSVKMHFLMVDEVQDLTQNLISLLMTMATKNIFFTGDTAQTIAKGVGFRFYDLKSIFDKQSNQFVDTEFNPPKVLQLTKNFRSHCRILDCANSVVALLELLFPKTIDKLLKETSDNDGPKPIVIEHPKPAALQAFLENYLIWGGDVHTKTQGGDYQFGCDRVVIVRDQESKASVPDFLSNVLCLTVYEAKGLEFDEVILYNFFSDNRCGSQWKLLNEVFTEQTTVKKVAQSDFMDFEMLDCQEAEANPQPSVDKEEETKDENATTRVDGDTEVTTVLSLKTEFAEVYRKFSQVCTELKLLYVAITRPKKLLLIYDQDTSMRVPILKHWAKVGVVDIVTAPMVNEPGTVPEAIRKVLRIGQDFSDQSQDQSQIQLQWRLQGFKLFKAKLYMAAKQCFNNSKDGALVIRCQAYEHAESAMTFRGQSEAKIAFYKDKNRKMKAFERNQYRKEARELLNQSKALMCKAGACFREIQMDKHAAQCFYSGDDNQSAVDLFVKLGQSGQAAESYLQLGKMREAANLYARAGLFANAFECYERLEDWDGLIQCIYRHKDKLDERERATYIDRYFPIALNSVYQLYANLDPEGASQMGINEENKGRQQQIRLRLKFQKSVSIIKEEVSDEEVEGEDPSSEEEDSAPDDSQDQASAKEELKEKPQSPDEEVKEPVTTMIDTTQANPKDEEVKGAEEVDDDDDSDGFQILSSDCGEDSDGGHQGSQGDDDQEKAAEQAKLSESQNLHVSDFEVLSQIDPEDEFLKSENSYSLIDKMSMSQTSSFDVLSQHSSEFSILSGTKMHSLVQSIKEGEADKSLSLGGSSAVESAVNGGGANSELAGYLNSSRFSAVACERDTYAEDIIMQKVIYYISLFKSDVRESLFKSRSKDQLSQALLDIESEQDASQRDISKPEFEEDMDFMMVELDELPTELQGLILDTLEHYELYRLCIVMCGRYQLHERLGRFIAAVSQKYSNLSSFRMTAATSPRSLAMPEQQQNFTLIAQEAMHNVIALANSCGQEERRHQIRESCFETLFMHGFWKKLVYLLDVDSSLQLSLALGDNKNFKLNYLVEKLGIKSLKKVNEAVEDATNSSFSKVVKEAKSGHEQLYKIFSERTAVARNDHRTHALTSDGLSPFKAGVLAKTARFQSKPDMIKHVLIDLKQRDVNSTFKIIDDIFKVHRGLQDGDIEMQRQVFAAFDISWLDGLDLFDNLSPNYCLYTGSSDYSSFQARYKQVKTCQNLAARFSGNLIPVAQLLEENKKRPAFTDKRVDKPLNRTFQLYQKIQRDLDSSKDIIGGDFAIMCDLEMKAILVPKQWAKEIVYEAINNFAFNSLEFLLAAKKSTQNMLQLQNAVEQVTTILTNQKYSVYDILTKTIKGCFDLSGVYKEELTIFLRSVGISLDDVPSYTTKRSSQLRYLEKLKHSLLTYEQPLSSLRKAMAVNVVLTRQPKFKITETISASGVDRALMDRTAVAHIKLQQAMKALDGPTFYSKIYRAVQLHIQEDFYLPVLEALTNCQTSYASRADQKAKASVALNLLDAHVYQKLNDYQSQVKGLLSFIRGAYEKLEMRLLQHLALQAFYLSVFSYMIFTYKVTHDGVLLRKQDYKMYVDPDVEIVATSSLVLPKLFIKPATLGQVVESLSWIQSIVTGVVANRDDKTMRTFCEESIVAIYTLLFNFSGEELIQMTGTISDIVKNTTTTLLTRPEDAANKNGPDQGRSSATAMSIGQIKKLQQSLNDIHKAKTAAQVKQSVKKSTDKDSAHGFTFGFKVSVLETERKNLQNEGTKKAVQANINAQLEVAGSVEEKVKGRRREAASKLCAYWQRKRQRLVDQRQEAFRLAKLEQEENQSSLDVSTLKAKYDSRQVQRAATRHVLVLAALDETDQLARSLTFLLGSIFVKSSLDQSFVIEKLKAVQASRHDFMAFINATFDGSGKNRGVQVSELKTRVESLRTAVDIQRIKLDEWLDRSDEKNAVVEQKKAKFRKMEKWNAVFSSRQAGQKREGLISQIRKQVKKGKKK